MNNTKISDSQLRCSFSHRRWVNFFSLWITYVSFYTARQNLSVAQPAMESSLGWSKADLGIISTCFAIAYAIGQVVNGQLADRIGGKRLLLTGIVMALLANLFFAMADSLWVMSLLWTVNGFFLATGVPANARINANWYAIHERGRYLGIFSTCGQVGTVVGLLLAGGVIGIMGWRYTFIVPCFVLTLIAVQMIIALKDSPQEAGYPSVNAITPSPPKKNELPGANCPDSANSRPAGFRYTIRFILTSSPILILALTYLLLGIVKNGLITWIPTYLVEEHQLSFDSAAYKSIVLPLVGAIGAIFAGWASDRFFSARRAPICVIFMLNLAGFLFLFRLVPYSNEILSQVMLGLAGFFLFGPYTLITTVAALDFGGEKAAASAAGFIDGMAYVGMALAGLGLGFVIDTFSWDGCFAVWICAAIMAALLMAILWKKKAAGVESGLN